jgi:hypothetical protein
VNENTSFGPTTNNFGVKPLKNPPIPSFLMRFFTIEAPLSGELNGRFWIRVLQFCRKTKGQELVFDNLRLNGK